MNMAKTPEYSQRAVKNYLKKFDRCAVNLPKGTADKIRATGESVNSFINRLVAEELERLEKTGTDQPQKVDNQEPAEPIPPDFVPPFN